MSIRFEHDLLGERAVPQAVYYGVHTLRALENFAISASRLADYPDLVVALADIKQAAALANCELGILSAAKCRVIVLACQELREGRLHEHFVVDMLQGGAGTSTNMNANEVIANRALELMGQARGAYALLHPNEDVNLSQSTNDVYPCALKLALHAAGLRLLDALDALRFAVDAKAVEFAAVLKMGRTQLQDAVPMTLGQEFATYSVMLDADRTALLRALDRLCEISLGATAIGTGINSPPGYAQAVRRHLANLTGLPLRTAPDLVAATQDTDAFVELSGVLKACAVKLGKVCNDLRMLSSGPRAGLGEINLPPMQAGSSIMPGKVNPVIPEVVNQVAFEVIGNDLTVTLAAQAGQLQLNAFEPVIAHSLFKSLAHLRAACHVLETRCISGITANTDFLHTAVRASIGLVTALNPYIGYSRASAIAREALVSGRGIAELVLQKGWLSQSQLDQILQPELLTQPRVDGGVGVPAAAG
ncbi:aspartate ammonia-lyase [Massilia niastensis]|uniref:aspartate ammonia-lyase n=1 Tax=Massilia niastensis TaxID=544911 RepID=UPI000380C77F|nr:aspartate ammonia-lyase [Massilia niastensis]